MKNLSKWALILMVATLPLAGCDEGPPPEVTPQAQEDIVPVET